MPNPTDVQISPHGGIITRDASSHGHRQGRERRRSPD